jgi:polyferredoxin
MRITTVRIITQTLVMTLFLAFVFITTFAHLNEYPALAFWVSKFLEIDPLVAISTAITTHTLYKGLIWSLVLLIPTLFLGRIFCNWICPYGIMHQFTGWVFNARNAKQRIESNRYRKLFQLKYYILIGFIVAALFHSLQIGLLDPICLLHRSFTASILPALNAGSNAVGETLTGSPLQRAGDKFVFGDPKVHQLGWVIGFIILFFVSMNLVIPRFFCRVVCPLGATLGVLSRFAIWRIERDPNKCTDCDLCLQSCEGASDPQTQLRKSECFVCFNCIEDCPHDALSFALLPKRSHEIAWPDIPKRKAIFAVVAGVLFYPFARLAGRTTKDFSAKVIRPPGSVEELEFLERCIKCDQCIRVCPTNVLQPAMFESGLEGVWTPVMNFRMGFCQLNCTACGQVCPTGAIQRLTDLTPMPVRLNSARRTTTSAVACRGRRTSRAWSARKSARRRRKRSTRSTGRCWCARARSRSSAPPRRRSLWPTTRCRARRSASRAASAPASIVAMPPPRTTCRSFIATARARRTRFSATTATR